MKTQRSFLPLDWRTNLLYDDSFIEQRLAQETDNAQVAELTDWLNAHYLPERFAKQSESQLENSFIQTLVKTLGWTVIPQISVSIQGKNNRPDWGLLENQAAYDTYFQNEDNSSVQLDCITVLLEAKKFSVELDKSANKHEKSPHFQLLEYLQSGQKRYGFLTNGRFWRLYDLERISKTKAYLEIDLTAVLALDDAEKQRAITLFCLLFAQRSYVKTDAAASSALEQLSREAEHYASEAEENLKAVIYGTNGEDSLFEQIGRALHARKPAVSLSEIYDNSIMLLFRLLFVVYFEDKNHRLLAQHPYYHQHGLQAIFDALQDPQADKFDGFYNLKNLFGILNVGVEDIDIPLFNGGLFDPDRAPMLSLAKIFNNVQLRQILEQLRYKTHRSQVLFEHRRDYKNMSVTHLGRIYEGLLEFRFERAAESCTYLEYESHATKGKTIEAYFDNYDLTLIRKEKGYRAWREISVKKGEVYLKSANNSRKNSASYYTPPSLSQPLVKAAIDQAVQAGKKLTDLRILDNACGSGHFLVEALGYLTDLARAQLERDAELQQLVQAERAKIIEQLQVLKLSDVPDDAQILKRVLLKRCIYGVDLNPFAVELARLSLWMDSFIFGTPLSFIEHHIQHGNALMGATVQDFIHYNAVEVAQNDLFVDDIGARFDQLRSVMHELDAMRDTTAAEVAQSKQLWKHSITPKLKLLSRALSFICTRRALLAEGDSVACEMLDKTSDLIQQLFDEKKGECSPLLKQIESYAQHYHFFHYEVAFPEAFAGENKGFDIIVGNPPWDKTKFSDADFFPQYQSNYRSLKNNGKAAVRQRLLESEHIAAAYLTTQREMEVADDYYTATLPLNKGAGDGNLFRLFVEHNLRLLARNSSLNYVLPSALMFEEGSTILRQHLLTHYQMPFFYSFENRNSLFLDVDSRYKFALMQLVKTPPIDDAAVIDTAFYVLDATELDAPARHIAYPIATLKALSPQHWAMMELRDGADLAILQKCYAAFPALSENWLNFRRELHMTDDKDLFMEQSAAGLLPLFEGKMIWQYSHLLDSPQYWLHPADFDARLKSKELHRMAQDLGVTKAEAGKYEDAIRYDREFIRLGFRAIASDTNERTLIFALLPKHCGSGHSMFFNAPKNYVRGGDSTVQVQAVSPLRILFALACFNTMTLDWMARQMIQINVSQTYLYRLPMPQPSDDEIRSNPDYAKLAKNALLLSLETHWEGFAELASLFNVQKKDLPNSPKTRDRLRHENDSIVAKLYGITPDEMQHLLKSFKVMQSKRSDYVGLFKS